MASERERILEEIGRHKKEISSFLDNFLEEWEEEGTQGRWRKDVRKRLQEMAKEGKMVRGTLVVIINKFYNGDHHDSAVKAGAAVELLHTGILMHDDIIDKDLRRRGMKTFQKQYRDLADKEGIEERKHFGISMALAGGDVSFFLGQNVLSSLQVPQNSRSSIQELVFREFSNVGLAEQVDIYSGYSSDEPSEDEILDLYRTKTARYTFSLPMKAGAIIADVDRSERKKLYRIGEKIGTIFQLKDDELGLFGDEEKIGEDIGSDLDEDKKTLHRLKLLERLSDEKEEEVREMLGTDMTDEEREQIKDLIREKNVKSDVHDRMEELAEEASEMIEELDLDKDSRDFLRKTTIFCLEREK